MANIRAAKILDNISLIIIGSGASIFYYYLEKSMASKPYNLGW